MTVDPKPQLSVQEYLRLEREAETKNEYLDGQMVAMTGGSLRHSLIIGNLVRELGNQLQNRPCQVFPSELRVGIPSANVYTYPDVSVACGDPLLEDEYEDTLLNPMLLIEVLSPTTEAYNRGKKLRWYTKASTPFPSCCSSRRLLLWLSSSSAKRVATGSLRPLKELRQFSPSPRFRRSCG